MDSYSALNSYSDSLMSGRQHPGSATPQNELELDTTLSVTSDSADVSLSIPETSLPPSSSLSSLDDIADDALFIPIKPPTGPDIPDTLDIDARFDKLVAWCTENAGTMADGVNILQAELAKTRRQLQKQQEKLQALMTKEASTISTMKETLEMTTSRLEFRQDTQEQRIQAHGAMLEKVLLGLETKKPFNFTKDSVRY